MITAAIWLAWCGVFMMAAEDGELKSGIVVIWRIIGLVLWTAAAILATIAVNR